MFAEEFRQIAMMGVVYRPAGEHLQTLCAPSPPTIVNFAQCLSRRKHEQALASAARLLRSPNLPTVCAATSLQSFADLLCLGSRDVADIPLRGEHLGLFSMHITLRV